MNSELDHVKVPYFAYMSENGAESHNLLDNEREGAEIGLPMPIQFNKIPKWKTITEIQFRYRCHQFKIMTSKKCRQCRLPKRAPKRTQQMCQNSTGNTGHTMKRKEQPNNLSLQKRCDSLKFWQDIVPWPREFQAKAGTQTRTKTDTKKCVRIRQGKHPNAHQNGHKKCARIRLRVMLDLSVM